jgi:drug/metabolite transporter (DMT)-like permease
MDGFIRNAKKRKTGILLSDFPRRGHVRELHYYESKAYYSLIAANLFLSVFFLLIRILYLSHHEDGGNSNVVNLFLGLYLLILAIVLLKIDNIDLSLRKNFNSSETDYLLIRCILGFFVNHFTILALSKIRLISSVTILSLAPVYSTYLIMKKQRETFIKGDKLSMLLCIVTMGLSFLNYTTGEDDKSDYFKGVIYALIAAILTAINNVIDKKINGEFHSYVILFVIGLYTVIITPIFIFFTGESFKISPNVLWVYLIIGASCYFGFYFNFKIIETNHLLINSPIHFTAIGLSYLYTAIVLNEGFSIIDLVAGILIIALNIFSKVRMEECEHEDNL